MPIVIMRYISNILLQQTECFHINFIIFIIIIVITIIILIIIFLLILLIIIIMLIIIIIVTPEYMTEVQLCVPWRCDFLHYLCRSYTIRKALLKFSKLILVLLGKAFCIITTTCIILECLSSQIMPGLNFVTNLVS